MWIYRLYIKSIRNSKSGPWVAFGVLFAGMLLNALAFMYFDEQTFGDAIWYSYISVTTIGYGDFYAVSTGARVCHFIFIGLGGLGSFSYLLGWAIDRIATASEKRRLGMAKVFAKNHVLIINFPNELRVKQMIREIRSDKEHTNSEFVVITDKLERLPFDIPNVEFVHGSPIEMETYRLANVEEATSAFILSTDYNDPESDALVSAIVGVIEHLNEKVKTVAECLQKKHKHMFDKVGCDSVVCVNEIGTNLLVQELQDHGVTEVFNVITSNEKTDGDTLFSVDMPIMMDSIYYNDLAHSLVDGDGNLVSVKRHGEDKIHTNFPKGMTMKEGDTVVFTASHRLSATDLIRLAMEYNKQASRAYGTEVYKKQHTAVK